MSSSTQKITCSACGRSGPWKPEFAGKRIKCKCGHVIEVALAGADGAAGPSRPTVPRPRPAPPIEIGAVRPQRTLELADAQLPEEAAAPIAAPADDHDQPDDLYDLKEEAPRPLPPRPAASLPGAAAPVVAGAPLGKAKAKNGQGKSTATAPSAPGAGFMGQSRQAGGARAKAAQGEAEEKKKQVMRLLAIFGGIVLVIAIVIVIIKFVPGMTRKPKLPDKAEDRVIAEEVDDKGSMDLKDWLKADSTHVCGPWTHPQAEGFYDKLKKMGARNIFVIGKSYALVRSIVIELPDDPAQRNVLLQWQADYYKAHDLREKVYSDEGQKYEQLILGA